MNGIGSSLDDSRELSRELFQVVVQFRGLFHLPGELLKEDRLIDGVSRHLGDVAEFGRHPVNPPGLDIVEEVTVFEPVENSVEGLVDDLLEFGVQFEVALIP
jgi:hypothetical protein